MAVKVTVYGTADLKQIDRARKQLNDLERSAKGNSSKFSKFMGNMGKSVRALAPVMLMAGAAAVALGTKLALAGERMQTSNARIENITRSMGLFGSEADNVSARLITLAEQQARATGIDQNAIKETQAKLLTFKELAATAGEVGGAFDRANQAALDLAAAGFGEATQNAAQLGKALNDPVKGLTALNRSGVTFTEVEKDKIKALVESGKMLEAQDTLLRAIETQVGGTAAATANGSDRAKVAFSQITELLGQELVPVMNRLAEDLNDVVENWDELVASANRARSIIDTARQIHIAMQFGPASLSVFNLQKRLEDAADAPDEFAREIDRMRGRINATVPALGSLGDALDDNADATEDTAAEYDKLTRAMDGTMVKGDELSGKMRTLTELNLDSQESALRLKQAEQQLAEALKEHGKGSDEAKEAQLRLERAKLRSSDATADLMAAEKEHGGTMEELAKQDAYEKHLRDIESAARDAAEAINTAKRRSLEQWGSRHSGGGAMAYGAGGLVTSPTHALVGERGHDEYVITTEPSYRSRSLALLDSLASDLGVRSSSSSTSYSIAVDARGATDPAATERAVRRAVDAAFAEAVGTARVKASMMGA